MKRAIDEAAWPLYPLVVDVQVFTPGRWEWSLGVGAPLLRHALEEGIQPWPAPATGQLWPTSRRPPSGFVRHRKSAARPAQRGL